MAVKVDLLLNDGDFSSKIKQAARGFMEFATAIKGAKNAQMALNAVIKANPFGLISTAAIAGAEALYKYITGVYDAEKAQEDLNAAIAQTKVQLESIDEKLDFDTKIAQAAGASWEALHQLKLEAAKTAESLAFETMTQAPFGSDERKEAEDMWNKARERLNKVNTEGTVNTLQHIYQTGPYKPKKGGGGGNNDRELTEEQKNQQKVNELMQQYVTLKSKENTAGNEERLAQLQEEIIMLQKRNQQIALFKEQAQGRMLGGNTDLPQAQSGLNFAEWKPPTDEEIKVKIEDFGKTLPKEDKNQEKKQQGTLLDGVSSIASGIRQMGIELPQGLSETLSVVQGISSILVGINTILGIIEATQTVIASTSAVKSIPGIGWLLSGGGTVKGQNVIHASSGYTVPGKFGYDAVPAMLTSGETVLNAAQTNNLASQLQGGGIGNLNLSATVSGEQIRLVLNNNGRRTGRGEYVTTNFR